MDRRVLGTLVGLIAVSTLSVTASIIGVVAFVDGRTEGLWSRLPYYVFVMAIAFTGLVFALEMRVDDGRKILSTSVVVSVIVFVLALLGVEGVIYSIENPSQVLSNILFFFLSAGLFCTAVMYWAVNHWREFVTSSRTRY